jgi:hypothetical protein
VTFNQFILLAPRVQVTHALMSGTFLALRLTREGKRRLYHMRDGGSGFFVEVGHDGATQRAVVLHTFNGSAPLEEYAAEVQLPEDWA